MPTSLNTWEVTDIHSQQVSYPCSPPSPYFADNFHVSSSSGTWVLDENSLSFTHHVLYCGVVNVLLFFFFCYRGGTSSAASFVNLGLSIDSPYPMQSKKLMTSTETIPEHRRVQTTAW